MWRLGLGVRRRGRAGRCRTRRGRVCGGWVETVLELHSCQTIVGRFTASEPCASSLATAVRGFGPTGTAWDSGAGKSCGSFWMFERVNSPLAKFARCDLLRGEKKWSRGSSCFGCSCLESCHRDQGIWRRTNLRTCQGYLERIEQHHQNSRRDFVPYTVIDRAFRIYT